MTARRYALLAATAVLLLTGPAQAFVYPLPIIVSSERDIWELYYAAEIDDVDRDRLLEIWDRGVDVLSAEIDELYELPGVTRKMAAEIVQRREVLKGFESLKPLEELLPDDVYIQAEPFIRIGESIWDLIPTVRGKTRFVAVAAESSRIDTSGLSEQQAANAAEYGSRELKMGGYWHTRAKIEDYAEVGVVASGRELTSDATWHGDATDPLGGAFRSQGASFGPQIDHFFLRSKAVEGLDLLAGSYRLGFGLGVVFDDTGRQRPHGFYPNMQMYDNDNGTVRAGERELGVAARARRLGAGEGWLDLTGFLSMNHRDLYQYEFTPRDVYQIDSDGELVKDTDGEDEKLSYQTFDDALFELLGGANLSYRFDKRNYIGLTGWGASASVDLEGAEDLLSFAQSSPYPIGGSFGALGLSLGLELGFTELAAELGMSWAPCDEIPSDWPSADDWAAQGLGFPPTSYCQPGQMIMAPAMAAELSFEPVSWVEGIWDLWYYSTDYANPHSSGPMASSEEHLGNRNRNQAGTRVKATFRPSTKLSFGGSAAIWKHLDHKPGVYLNEDDSRVLGSANTPSCAPFTGAGSERGIDAAAVSNDCYATTDAEVSARINGRPTDDERVGLIVTFHDEDLDNGGRIQTYDESGSRYRLLGRVRTERLPKTVVQLSASYTLVDEKLLDCDAPEENLDGVLECKGNAQTIHREAFDREWWAALQVRIDLRPGPRITLRAKYLDEALADTYDSRGNFKAGDQRGETSLDAYVKLEQKIGNGVKIGLRYRMVQLLDDRPNAPSATAITKNRRNPEHYGRISLEVGF